MKEEIEIWKDIKDYEGLYQVSNMGRVKSLGNGKAKNPNLSKERILKQTINKNKYYNVQLFKEGKGKNYLVHRIVAQTFLSNSDNLSCVNHKDENKTNNCASNLEFCTHQYNSNYGTIKERLSKAHKGKKKSQETKEKMSKTKSISILQLSKSGNIILGKWDSALQASNELGICRQNINKCLKGKTKTAYGYKWMYYEDYINRMNNYFDLALKEVS